jgi:CPA2 family monovalent cation:H+ antiporter-2
MLLNVHLVLENWWLVLVLLAGPVLLKFALIAAAGQAVRRLGRRVDAHRPGAGAGRRIRLRAAELTGGAKLIDPFLIQLVLASMVLSMLVAPFLIAKIGPDRDEDLVQRMDDAVAGS